jgi:heavy metal sensor kinase
MPDSIRARLTLWYAAALAVTIAAVAAGEYLFFSRALYRRMDDSLLSNARVLSQLLEAERAEGETPAEAATSVITESALAEQAVAILDPEGKVLASRAGPAGVQLPGAGRAGPPGHVLLSTVESEGARLRLVAHGTQLSNGERYTILLGHRLGPLEADLGLIRRAALLAIVNAVAGAGLGGWVLAGRTLAPVLAMCEQARQIGAGALGKRLDLGNPRDELGTLARTFNDLLDRLALSFDRQRQFMADASHELRTPLSVVRTAATMTLEKQQRAEAEYREALHLVAEESRRLSRLVEDMMTLARADAGHHPLRPRRFCLAELLFDVARSASLLGRPRGIAVSFAYDGEVPIFGDEDLVRRMLVNVVENAVAHNPEGTPVVLRLDPSSEASWDVTILDRGPGIPGDEQERVFDRFHRVERAGETVRPGAGLGLAIARWIAEAHGGSIQLVSSDAAGTTFVVTLPANVRSSSSAAHAQAPAAVASIAG